jgi:energy-coupling factor transport system permease protein
VALLTLNPLYVLLLAMAAGVNYLAVGQRSPLAQSWSAFIRVGLLIWVITIPFNALLVHQGLYVLFHLPASWPLLGGPITLEGVAYGVVKGLSLIVILVIFATFNSAVDQARLLRRMPAFLYLISMVTSIALAFVPQMFAVLKEIREAQRIRGHRFKGLRDLLPLFVPLLTTGMERAVQLAESMESRGFGGNIAPVSRRREMVHKLLTLLGLLGLLFGVFASSYWGDRRWIGALLAFLSAATLVLVFWMQSRRVTRTRYRREWWLRSDWIVSATSLLALAGVVMARLLDRMALFYYPYPPYSIWPAFDPRIGALMLLFVAPALLLPGLRKEMAPAIGPAEVPS